MYQNEDEDKDRYEILGSAALYAVVAGGIALVLVTTATHNVLRGAAVGVVAAVFVAAIMLVPVIPGLVVVGIWEGIARLFKKSG